MPPTPDNGSFLPYARQLIEDDDIDAVVKVLKSTHLTTGPVTESFEAALTTKTGADHAVSCSSGTAALHLAALALGLGPGDTVIVPTITFLATANAAHYVGANVVFADVDPGTGLMRPEDFLDALERSGNKAKAVFPVHLAGQSPDMEAIGKIARENGLFVVEDACHALGTTYVRDGGASKTQDRAGNCRHGDMTVFSFHPAKTVAMGEGGAITTNDAGLAERLRLLRNHGMAKNPGDFKNNDMAFDANGEVNPWYYEMANPGLNYRASDIHCALGLSQLGKLDRFAERRRELAACYDGQLAKLSPLVRPINKVPGNNPAWHLYIVLIDFKAAGISRADIMHFLHQDGIGTQVHFIPVHLQPFYRQRYGEADLPGSMEFYRRCLSLPLFPAMTKTDVDRVAVALEKVLSGG